MTARSRLVALVAKYRGIISSPAFMLVLILLIEFLRSHAFIVPNPISILLLVIVFSAFAKGRTIGLVNTAVALAYLLYFYSNPGQLFRYTPDNLLRVVLWALTLPVVTLLVSELKHHLDLEKIKLLTEITERQRAETQFRALLESAPEATVIVNHEGKIHLINAQAERLFGYKRDELLGDHLNILIPESFRPAHVIHETAYMQNPHIRAVHPGMELYARHKDGHTIPVEISLGPIQTQEGLLVVATVRDITEYRRVNQALRESEARHHIVSRLIWNYACAYRYQSDDNDTASLEWVIGAFEPITGHSIEQALKGFSLSQPVHPDDLHRFQQRQQKLHSGQEDVSEFRIVNKHGDVRWVRSYGLPEWDADHQHVVRVYIAVQDITEHKRVEENLRQSEERYRAISELITDNAYSCIIRPDGTFSLEWIIGSFSSITGYTPDEIGSTYMLYHPDDAAKAAEDVKTVMAGSPAHGEYRIVTKTGDIRWVEIRRFPIFDADHRVIRFYGATREITAQKRAEAQRLELQIEHERAEILKQFLRDASHDLKTPLTAINTTLYLLKKSPDPNKRGQHIDNLERQVNRIQILLEDMFTLSRLDLEATELPRELCNLNFLVREVSKRYSDVAAAKNHRVALTLDPNLPQVFANEQEFAAALRHLLTNALNFTPPGGEVVLETYQEQQQVVVAIRDSGMGISAEDLPHIFERFYRADKARGTNTGGSGLGLAIVRKIIDAHQGRIEVESTQGKGSTFRVRLPIAASEPPPPGS